MATPLWYSTPVTDLPCQNSSGRDQPRFIASDGTSLYVAYAQSAANPAPNLIEVLNPSGGDPRQIYGPETNPIGLTFTNGSLWVSYDSGRIYELDPVQGTVRSSFVAPQGEGGARPFGLAFDDQQSLWLIQHGMRSEDPYQLLRVDITTPIIHTVQAPATGVNFGLFLGQASGYVKDAADHGLEGWRVYADTNGTGRYEPWELFADTDSSGQFLLKGLRPDAQHTIREVVRQPGWDETLVQERPVTVTVSGEIVDAAMAMPFVNRLEPNANLVPIGRETLVNQTTAGVQGFLNTWEGQVNSVASDGKGNYVVVWEGTGVGDDVGIFARVFFADGTPATSEFRVNVATTGNQIQPVVTMAENDTFAVAWASQGASGTNSVSTRVFTFNPNGTPATRLTMVTGDVQVTPVSSKANRVATSIAMDAVGNFVVLVKGTDYKSFFDNGGLIEFRRYNASGQAQNNVTQVVDATLTDGTASMAMAGTGNFVVTWNDSAGPGLAVRAQRYDRLGRKVGKVLTPTVPINWPSVACDREGKWFVIAGEGKAQTFTFTGVPVASFDLTTEPVAQDRFAVAMDASGDVVLTWGDRYNSCNVIARRSTLYGVVDDPFVVNTTTAGVQNRPSVAVTGAGSFVVAWSGNGVGDDSGVFVQRYSAPTGTTGSQTAPATVDQVFGGQAEAGLSDRDWTSLAVALVAEEAKKK